MKEIKLTGQTENISEMIYSGVKRTYIRTPKDSPYGPNKINVVQFDPKDPALRIDVMPCATYANELRVVTSLCERIDKEGDMTPIAAVNGDLWMVSYAHARVEGKGTSYGGCSDPVVKKSMTTPRGLNIYAGEIISTPHLEKETPFEGKFSAYGLTDDGRMAMGEPDAVINVKNLSDGTVITPDGLNRLPANNALIMYTDRLLSEGDYALDDAYEVRIKTPNDYKICHGANIKGKVEKIFSSDTPENPEKIKEDEIVLTARGESIPLLSGLKEGDCVEITVEIIDKTGRDTKLWGEITNAVGGHICFADHGVLTGEDPSCDYPATIIGCDKDGVMMFITMDGRREDSVGSNPKNLPVLAKDLDLYNAFLVDGGGSATLVTRQNDGAYKVVNTPCDPGDTPRPVINAVVLSVKK